MGSINPKRAMTTDTAEKKMASSSLGARPFPEAVTPSPITTPISVVTASVQSSGVAPLEPRNPFAHSHSIKINPFANNHNIKTNPFANNHNIETKSEKGDDKEEGEITDSEEEKSIKESHVEYRSLDRKQYEHNVFGPRNQNYKVDKHRLGEQGRNRPTIVPSRDGAISFKAGNSGGGPRTSRSFQSLSSSSHGGYKSPSEEAIQDILRQLERRPSSNFLSRMLNERKVQLDLWKRNTEGHVTEATVRQFDFNLPHVRQIARRMVQRYDTVTVYSLHMLTIGTIVYYKRPYMVGVHDKPDSHTAVVGGEKYNSWVKVKGRFGIVVSKFSNSFTVAEITTFNWKGLSSKPEKTWNEYVQLVPWGERVRSFAPYEPLQVEDSFFEVMTESYVHLVPVRVSLTDHVMIAGFISHAQVDRLRWLIECLDKDGSHD